MSAQKLDEDIRSKYLDRMKDESERQRTLRFLAATSKDAAVRGWAEKEGKIVEEQVAKLKRDIAETNKQLSEAAEQATKAMRQKDVAYTQLSQRAADLKAAKASLEAQLRAPPPTRASAVVSDAQDAKNRQAIEAYHECVDRCPDDEPVHAACERYCDDHHLLK